jgi:hypothetical protein
MEEFTHPSLEAGTTPWLILDPDEEIPACAPGGRGQLRLIIDRVEPTPSGPDSAEDKTMSILAGCGVLFAILLLAALVSIAPLIAGTGPAGITAPAAIGSSGLALAFGPLTNVTEPLVVGNEPSPEEEGVPTVGAPGAVGSQVIPSATLPPQSAPAKSYVTLQPVPVSPPPPSRDIGTNLPLPVTDDYFTIYSMDARQAQQNIPYVVFELRNPPLVIDYTVTPMNITDVKEHDYKIMATRHRENTSITRPYEQSWFQAVVRDNATSAIVLEDGYGKTFAQEPSGQLVLYKSGKYRFEFSGGNAIVSLTMKVKKEGNIP